MTTQPIIDAHATLEQEQYAAQMRFREAILALLRAWEEMNNLPRSIPTRAERASRTAGGHTKRYDDNT